MNAEITREVYYSLHDHLTEKSNSIVEREHARLHYTNFVDGTVLIAIKSHLITATNYYIRDINA